jgi:hypothetical protein
VKDERRRLVDDKYAGGDEQRDDSDYWTRRPKQAEPERPCLGWRSSHARLPPTSRRAYFRGQRAGPHPRQKALLEKTISWASVEDEIVSSAAHQPLSLFAPLIGRTVGSSAERREIARRHVSPRA